nr:PDZ domain containing protein [Haemonchus contortus]
MGVSCFEERTPPAEKGAKAGTPRKASLAPLAQDIASAKTPPAENTENDRGSPAAKTPPAEPAQDAQGRAGATTTPNELAQDAPLIPPERKRNFIVREGYAYFLATIILTPGMKFGLGLKHYRNKVVVSKVEDGSMVADILKVMDHICDVCSKPVTDKDICRRLIVKALKANGEVNMIVERPIEPDAVKEMENALNASRMQEPSMALAPDVKDIIRRYSEKLQAGHGQAPAKKALTDSKKERRQEAQRNVNFDVGGGKSHISYIIGCDLTKSQQEKLTKVPPHTSQGTPGV